MRQEEWKTVRLAVLVITGMLLCSGCAKRKEYVEPQKDIADSFPIAAEAAGENPQLVLSAGPHAVLHTTAGDITILLYPKQAPKAVENFITLAEEGYYDGSLFYYTKRDELTQTGIPRQDSADENLMEEERSIWDAPFEDEFDDGLHNFQGAVGMAHDGMNQNRSQFYLLVQNTIPEEEQVISASFYMNELVRMRTAELNEQNLKATMSDAEIAAFESELNEEIQRIATDGIPDEYRKRYEPAVEQYKKVGGAWGLDYNYTVFGQIVDGLNVANAITQVKVDAATRKPKKDVVIESIEILE